MKLPIRMGLALVACASLASCNWYDITKGQQCCSGSTGNGSSVTTSTIVDKVNPPPVGMPNGNPASQPCNEDQPCWNCLTMGNHICGPGAKLPDGSYANPKDDPRSYDGYGTVTPVDHTGSPYPIWWKCQVEPSENYVGYEVIAYPPGKTPLNIGFAVPCR